MFLISAAVWVLLCGSVGSGAEVHWKADDCTGREVNMTEANMGRVVEFYEWCLGLAAGLPDTGRRHKFGRVTASRLKGAVKRFANSSSLPPERLASVREQFGHLYFLLKDAGLPVAARRRKTFTRTSFHLPSTCSPSTTPCDRHAFRRPKFLKFCFFKRLCPSLTVCLLYIFLFVLIVALVIVVCIKLRRKKKCDSLDSSGHDLEEGLEELFKIDSQVCSEQELKKTILARRKKMEERGWKKQKEIARGGGRLGGGGEPKKIQKKRKHRKEQQEQELRPQQHPHQLKRPMSSPAASLRRPPNSCTVQSEINTSELGSESEKEITILKCSST